MAHDNGVGRGAPFSSCLLPRQDLPPGLRAPESSCRTGVFAGPHDRDDRDNYLDDVIPYVPRTEDEHRSSFL
jgi:hypothetical protein